MRVFFHLFYFLSKDVISESIRIEQKYSTRPFLRQTLEHSSLHIFEDISEMTKGSIVEIRKVVECRAEFYQPNLLIQPRLDSNANNQPHIKHLLYTPYVMSRYIICLTSRASVYNRCYSRSMHLQSSALIYWSTLYF